MDTVSPQQAAKLVTKLKQPSDMRTPTWRRMQKVLRALCSYLPNPYPSTYTLFKKTGIPQPTVARLLARAEGLNLISRVERGHSYAYRLTYIDDSFRDSTSAQVESEKRELRSQEGTTYLLVRSAGRFGGPAARPRRINRYTGRCDVCAETVRAGEGFLHGHLPVHRECDLMPIRGEMYGVEHDSSPVHGEDPEAPLPTLTARPPQPQVRLAKYFEQRWNTDALGLHPEWRGEYRGIEVGMGIGYIKRTFLDAGYSDEHVEAMIDAFFDDLINPSCALEIRQGQTAFQRFTGWWGHNLVPDPRIERERQAEHDRLLTAARTQAKTREIRRQAAWARIDAATERGESPDRDDLREVGMPYVLPGRQVG